MKTHPRWAKTAAFALTTTFLIFHLSIHRSEATPIAGPTVQSASPADGAWFSTAGLTVSGTAVAGSYPLSNILYGVNGGGITNVATGKTNWSFAFIRSGITNTVSIQAQDTNGLKSAVISRSYVYSGAQPATLNIVGAGHIWPPQLVGANLTVGQTYTFVAISNNINSAFVSWSDNQTPPPGFGIPVGNVTKTFTMSPGLVLTATFTNNPFVGAAGTYFGLFYEGQGSQQQGPPSTPSFESCGWIRFVVDNRGNFSAQIWANGHPASMSGHFDIYGNAVPDNDVIPTGDSDPLDVQLKLNFDDTLGGTISLVVDNEGPQLLWSSTIRALKATINRGNTYLGNYNFVIPPETVNTLARGPISSQPRGMGVGSINVSDVGLASASGATADGQPFRSLASGISAGGEFPLFALSQNQTIEGSRVKDYRSVLIGWMQFNQAFNNTITKATKATGARNTNPYIVNGTLTWDKLPAPDLYPNGFAFTTDAYGSYYRGIGPNYPFAVLNFYDGVSSTYLLDCSLLGGSLSVTDTNFIHTSTFYFGPGELRGRFQYSPMSEVQQTYRGIYLPYQDLIGGYYTGDGQNGAFTIEPGSILPPP